MECLNNDWMNKWVDKLNTQVDSQHGDRGSGRPPLAAVPSSPPQPCRHPHLPHIPWPCRGGAGSRTSRTSRPQRGSRQTWGCRAPRRPAGFGCAGSGSACWSSSSRSAALFPGAAPGRRRCRGRERGPAVTSETPGLRHPPPARAPGGSPVGTIAYELYGLKVILSRWLLSLAAAALQRKGGDDGIIVIIIIMRLRLLVFHLTHGETEAQSQWMSPSFKCHSKGVTKSELKPKTDWQWSHLTNFSSLGKKPTKWLIILIYKEFPEINNNINNWRVKIRKTCIARHL